MKQAESERFSVGPVKIERQLLLAPVSFASFICGDREKKIVKYDKSENSENKVL
jgi:hypothetical protein